MVKLLFQPEGHLEYDCVVVIRYTQFSKRRNRHKYSKYTQLSEKLYSKNKSISVLVKAYLIYGSVVCDMVFRATIKPRVPNYPRVYSSPAHHNFSSLNLLGARRGEHAHNYIPARVNVVHVYLLGQQARTTHALRATAAQRRCCGCLYIHATATACALEILLAVDAHLSQAIGQVPPSKRTRSRSRMDVETPCGGFLPVARALLFSCAHGAAPGYRRRNARFQFFAFIRSFTPPRRSQRRKL